MQSFDLFREKQHPYFLLPPRVFELSLRKQIKSTNFIAGRAGGKFQFAFFSGLLSES